MEVINQKFLAVASIEGRFERHARECHHIHVSTDGETVYTKCEQTSHDDTGCPFISKSIPVAATVQSSKLQHSLACLLQRSRPPHKSRQPATLPFADAPSTRALFEQWNLPTAYFHTVDGTPSIIHSHAACTTGGAPLRFDFLLRRNSRKEGWSMALRHELNQKRVSVYLSLNPNLNASELINDLVSMKDYAFHPMLLPCIMFATVHRSAQRKRNTIKENMVLLEDRIHMMHSRASKTRTGNTKEYHASNLWLDQPKDAETLDELLFICRTATSSREGQYSFWHSFYTSLQRGFEYAEQALSDVPAECFDKAQSDLKQWAEITWQKLESLKSSHKDHVARIDTASGMLNNLIQQRDSQIQETIAKALRGDSEDMKFISLLGSVFLPASLVATILNVPAFQFLDGASDPKLVYGRFVIFQDYNRAPGKIICMLLLTSGSEQYTYEPTPTLTVPFDRYWQFKAYIRVEDPTLRTLVQEVRW